jgi:hypothetical protein
MSRTLPTVSGCASDRDGPGEWNVVAGGVLRCHSCSGEFRRAGPKCPACGAADGYSVVAGREPRARGARRVVESSVGALWRLVVGQGRLNAWLLGGRHRQR